MMDNLQLMMLNEAIGGKAWVAHDVHIDQTPARNEVTHVGFEEMWEYAKEHWLDKRVANGTILPQKSRKIQKSIKFDSIFHV
ncbi:MAG: hypothetical protein LIO56_00055 [Lachnospiraceae bacterium]|nr:hypothetical protein [Lachnospiraceae bacterium]